MVTYELPLTSSQCKRRLSYCNAQTLSYALDAFSLFRRTLTSLKGAYSLHPPFLELVRIIKPYIIALGAPLDIFYMEFSWFTSDLPVESLT